MSKSERMATFVGTLGADAGLALDPCYQGYFRLFNDRRYYEAHDVLEHLWLGTPRAEPDHAFYKGLIQVAGAFVHLQKQHDHPHHAKHGRRLRPAARLFALALGNLAPFRPRHLALDVDGLCRLCEAQIGAITGSDFTRNPWTPGNAPHLAPRPADGA